MNRLDYICDWQKKNWSRVLEYKRRWRQKNPQKMQQARENWKANNPERVKVVRNLCRRIKYASDPQYKTETILRTKFNRWLFRRSGARSVVMTSLSGASKLEVRNHIESLFKPGMTWKNHGYNGWHIDHKIPCAEFDLTNTEQQRRCFHYTNLQPLWKPDHIRKHGKGVRK